MYKKYKTHKTHKRKYQKKRTLKTKQKKYKKTRKNLKGGDVNKEDKSKLLSKYNESSFNLENMGVAQPGLRDENQIDRALTPNIDVLQPPPVIVPVVSERVVTPNWFEPINRPPTPLTRTITPLNRAPTPITPINRANTPSIMIDNPPFDEDEEVDMMDFFRELGYTR